MNPSQATEEALHVGRPSATGVHVIGTTVPETPRTPGDRSLGTDAAGGRSTGRSPGAHGPGSQVGKVSEL